MKENEASQVKTILAMFLLGASTELGARKAATKEAGTQRYELRKLVTKGAVDCGACGWVLMGCGSCGLGEMWARRAEGKGTSQRRGKEEERNV